ncbi:hypothetical protein GS506_24495, partial [Rhodococcus hoagii]|nr:hypothetical protein [Prescottella equi]
MPRSRAHRSRPCVDQPLSLSADESPEVDGQLDAGACRASSDASHATALAMSSGRL